MPQLTDKETSLIGKESAPRTAPYAVNEPMARFWCEMVEDPNPIYFDEEYARSTWLKEPFAPPAMLFTWGMQPVWPESQHESAISRLHLPRLHCDACGECDAGVFPAAPIRRSPHDHEPDRLDRRREDDADRQRALRNDA